MVPIHDLVRVLPAQPVQIDRVPAFALSGGARSLGGVRVGAREDPAEIEADRIASELVSAGLPRYHRGIDFARVPVHANSRTSEALHARAFSTGDAVYFAPGRFDLSRAASRVLYAHELAHVVQAGGRPGLIRRQPDTAVTPFAGIDTGDPALFRQLLAVLDAIGVPVAGRDYPISVSGRSATLTADQLRSVRAAAMLGLRHALFRARTEAESARDLYTEQQRINDDGWVNRAVSWTVTTVGRIDDPGGVLIPTVAAAVLISQRGEIRLGSGPLLAVLADVETATTQAAQAHRLAYKYWNGIIDTAEHTVTALTAVRDASFVTLGVLATIASGGAALGISGTAIGGTAATANAIAVAAPIVASLAQTGAQVALGQPVDWTHLAVDTIASVVLARFGGALGNRAFRLLGGNPAVQNLGRIAFTRALSSVLAHEGTTVLRVGIDQLEASARGRPRTWGQMVDQLAAQMADPSGVVFAAVVGVAGGAIESKAARTGPSALPPGPAVAGPASQRPALNARSAERPALSGTSAPAPATPRAAVPGTGTAEPTVRPRLEPAPPRRMAGVSAGGTGADFHMEEHAPTPAPALTRRGGDASRSTQPEVEPTAGPHTAGTGPRTMGSRLPAGFEEDALAALDAADNPFHLNVSAGRLADIESNRRPFTLHTPTSFDVDEPLAVGERGIKPQRAVARALDPHNRQLLDPATNRRTKYLGTNDAAASGSQRSQGQVSVLDDPNAIFTRRFSEVTELETVFHEAVARVRNPGKLRPTELKERINRNVRDIIGEGQTPSGQMVQSALRSIGFEFVAKRGIVAVRRPQR